MKCPYCNSNNTEIFYEENQPTLVAACNTEKYEKIKKYPIKLYLCNDCLLGFNSKPLPDEELKFIYDDYDYISPFKGIGTTKYEGMIAQLKKYCKKKDYIIEIGSSEGYLLKKLSDLGYNNLLGYEPGPQADEAKNLGLNVLKDYFTKDSLGDNKADVFYLMHVFEHFPDPFEIIRILNNKLNSNGKIIIEVPYFGGYQHQHLYYYNISFIKKLASDINLRLVDVKVDLTNLNFVLEKNIDNEKGLEEIFNDSNYISNKAKKLYNLKKEQKKKVNDILSKSNEIIWWGAGSSSVLNLNRVSDEYVSKIKVVDGDKNKWGKKIPGVGIEVLPYTDISGKRFHTIIIASEFEKEIKETMQNNNIIAENIYNIV